MSRTRRVKIISTIGPASWGQAAFEALINAGADVFRINMSHTSHALLREAVADIRSVEEKLGTSIGILVDLQGPKLRVGRFEAPYELTGGAAFRLDNTPEPGNQDRVFLPHPEIIEHAQVGHRLLIDDGRVTLRVTAVAKDHLDTEVVYGGRISSNKGVSLPDTELPAASMTEKDRADIGAAIQLDIDWIALSFVQRAEDMIALRQLVGPSFGLVAKLEKPQMLPHLDAIISASDAVMVARGDLGVELPMEQVPSIQKMIVHKARALGRPVIVATQMLESMISSPVPTRAEATDVSVAVFEGVDAIMLSAETASGKYPVEAVNTMHRIASTVEQDSGYPAMIRISQAIPERTIRDAVAAGARHISEVVGSAAVAVYTVSGNMALRIARERPVKPIIALTSDRRVARRMRMVWGTSGTLYNANENVAMAALAAANEHGYTNKADSIVLISGPVSTDKNALRVLTVKD
ncbi:pyruvate kinase [Devosia sp. 2618]|uniref:pyruvate kinase n=1 Tax=Devosia sp. 2618 TaxID=3156454 RepID=UPI003397BA2C